MIAWGPFAIWSPAPVYLASTQPYHDAPTIQTVHLPRRAEPRRWRGRPPPGVPGGGLIVNPGYTQSIRIVPPKQEHAPEERKK